MIKLVENEPEAFLFIMLGNFRILQAKWRDINSEYLSQLNLQKNL